MRQVDLVVMGGGPAGAAAARTARARGLSVVVVDKARFPRDKLCGGLLTGRSAGHLARIFGLDVQAEADLFLRRDQLAFAWKGQEFTRAASPVPLHLTMRRAFDAALLAAARAAGAEVHEGARAADPGLARGVLVLDSGEEIGWRALIGADGVNSAVARGLFGQAFDPARIGFCLEAEVPLDQSLRPRDAPVLLDLGGVPWGYAWSFPKARTVTLGLVAPKARVVDFRARMERLMAAHVRDPGRVQVKGQFIPYGDFRPVPGRGRVLLAGDAAGLVDALTGEGIAYALDSGQRAAAAVADWLAGGGTGDLVETYARGLGQIHASLAASTRLAATMHSRLLPAVLKRRLVAHPRVQAKLMAILAGQAEASEVATFDARQFLGLKPG